MSPAAQGMSRDVLVLRAGPRARAVLRERGLRPQDVRVIPAAAGGPKGLVLMPLDRFLFGHWLPSAGPQAAPVHLVGASIGAWRLVNGAMADPLAALDRLADDYIHQTYDVPPGDWPTPAEVSRVFRQLLGAQIAGHEAALLQHPRWRLHLVTSRGIGPGLGGRDDSPACKAGLGLAWAANALSRRALGRCLQRVLFSDPRTPLPLAFDDLSTARVPLRPDNLADAAVASGSIPLVLRAVTDIAGAPPGLYWDGGLTDYHLHWPWSQIDDGLVLYPHFQRAVVPGWFDKPWASRSRPGPGLDNLVLLHPHPDWVARLPGGQLPDRRDFRRFGADVAARQRGWREALAASQALAEAFAQLCTRSSLDALPL
jgi:hypothetical protein